VSAETKPDVGLRASLSAAAIFAHISSTNLRDVENEQARPLVVPAAVEGIEITDAVPVETGNLTIEHDRVDPATRVQTARYADIYRPSQIPPLFGATRDPLTGERSGDSRRALSRESTGRAEAALAPSSAAG
jgi:hypothetical protein